MESTVIPLENTDELTRAIDAARAIKAKYVDDRLQWYKTHKVLPRVLYLLDTTECRRPVQWNAVADSRFGTLVIRHRIQSNSAMGKAVY